MGIFALSRPRDQDTWKREQFNENETNNNETENENTKFSLKITRWSR